MSYACKLDDNLLEAYLRNERSINRDIGYPYLVSFNDKRDASLVKKAFDLNWIDDRTLDCMSLNNCVALVSVLISNGIKNIDLGAFQINRRYWVYDIEDYFNSNAKTKVCEIVKGNAEQYGWSWETLARYHSSTPKLNEKYKQRLIKNYKKVANK